MSKISTYVMDQSKGRPAVGLEVRLLFEGIEIGKAVTDNDGLVKGWMVDGAGIYRLCFETGKYFKGETFFPSVEICFELRMEAQYHVPLLLSPWGYSTYRGS